jgi:ABC-type sugar transport system substrate-binding protein
MLPSGGNVLCVTGPQRSSAAQQRLAGAKSTLKAGINLFDTEAGQWTEADGIGAFNGWYGIFKARADVIQVVAAHNDELATGARNAAKALANPGHREMFAKAKYLGVDASPRYGRRLVDSGGLTASITTPANTGMAIAQLQSFWRDGRAVPLRAFTEATAYPLGSAG